MDVSAGSPGSPCWGRSGGWWGRTGRSHVIRVRAASPLRANSRWTACRPWRSGGAGRRRTSASGHRRGRRARRRRPRLFVDGRADQVQRDDRVRIGAEPGRWDESLVGRCVDGGSSRPAPDGRFRCPPVGRRPRATVSPTLTPIAGAAAVCCTTARARSPARCLERIVEHRDGRVASASGGRRLTGWRPVAGPGCPPPRARCPVGRGLADRGQSVRVGGSGRLPALQDLLTVPVDVGATPTEAVGRSHKSSCRTVPSPDHRSAPGTPASWTSPSLVVCVPSLSVRLAGRSGRARRWRR